MKIARNVSFCDFYKTLNFTPKIGKIALVFHVEFCSQFESFAKFEIWRRFFICQNSLRFVIFLSFLFLEKKRASKNLWIFAPML